MRSYMMEDASAVINIHPDVDILSIHQYEKLYMMEDASPVIDNHPNVDILSTHQYECGASSKEKGAHNSLFWPIADQLIMQLLCNNIDV